MRTRFVSRAVVAWSMIVSCALPTHLLAGDPAPAGRTQAGYGIQITDVALGEGGLLMGQVVSAQGDALVEREISIITNSGRVTKTISDSEGRFAYQGLQGGIYQIRTENSLNVCRAWIDKTAPPSATRSLLVVSEPDAVLGQWGPPGPASNSIVQGTKNMLTNPLVVGGVIAAAIAIPVAIHNSDDDGPSS